MILDTDLSCSSRFTDVTGFVAVDDTRKLIVVSFRGTNSLENALQDVLIVRIPAPEVCEVCALPLLGSFDSELVVMLGPLCFGKVVVPKFHLIKTFSKAVDLRGFYIRKMEPFNGSNLSISPKRSEGSSKCYTKTISTNQFLHIKECTACKGFLESYRDVRQPILTAVQSSTAAHPDYQVIVTGHSLGGALANLCAADLRNQHVSPLVDLYTFGAPRTGDQDLAAYITAQAPAQGANYRVTHRDDPVPRVPPKSLGYGHPLPQYYIDSGTFETVAGGDVQVFSQDNSGDDLPVNIFDLDVPAHLWYFAAIGICLGFTGFRFD